MTTQCKEVSEGALLAIAPWKTLETSVILERKPFLSIENHKVRLPDGSIIPDWTIVVTPDYVNVVVLVKSAVAPFLVFRQTKYAIGLAYANDHVTLALVGGLIDSEETPLEAAKRELKEETGYSANTWIPLGASPSIVDPNRGAGKAYMFLALDAIQEFAPTNADLEEQQIMFLKMDEIETALMSGMFKHTTWQLSISLGLLYLKRIELNQN